MKVLKSSIFLAVTFLLLAVTSACIAEGLMAESIRRVMPNLPNNSAARDMDEAHRQLKEANPDYNAYERDSFLKEHDQQDRNLYRLNLCYSEPKPSWCK